MITHGRVHVAMRRAYGRDRRSISRDIFLSVAQGVQVFGGTKRKGTDRGHASRARRAIRVDGQRSARQLRRDRLGAGPVGQNVAPEPVLPGSLSRSSSANSSAVNVPLGLHSSKSLLRPVIAVADARRVDGAREAVSSPVSVQGVFGRRDRYVTLWDDTGQANGIKEIGAELIRGHARLHGTRRVAVATSDDELVVLTARHAVAVCTGSTATLPDIPGVSRGAAVDQPQSDGQQRSACTSRCRRRGRCRRRNGHGMARSRLAGHPPRSRPWPVAKDGAVCR